MNAFEAYSKKAATIMSSPAKLLGPNKLRAEARVRYSEIVACMDSCESAEDLELYLTSIKPELTQFHAELQFYWEGDDTFTGLQREIERSKARVDDGLDYPRHEPRGQVFEEETGQ